MQAGVDGGAEQRLGVRVEFGGDGDGADAPAPYEQRPDLAAGDVVGLPLGAEPEVAAVVAGEQPASGGPDSRVVPAVGLGGALDDHRRAGAQGGPVDDDGVHAVEPPVGGAVEREDAAAGEQQVERGGEGLPAQDGGLGSERLEQVGGAAGASGERQDAEGAGELGGGEAVAVGLDRPAGEFARARAGRLLGCPAAVRLRKAELALAAAPDLAAGAHLQRPLDRRGGVDRRDGGALGEGVQERAGALEDEVGADRADAVGQRVLQPLLGVQHRHEERGVPVDGGDRQVPGGGGDADGRRVDGGGEDRGQQRFEVGRVVGALREDVPAAAGLLDLGDHADDVRDGDAAGVDGDQDPAEDVVDGGPLDALQSLEVAAERGAGLGGALVRGGLELDLQPVLVAPDAAGVAGRRGLEHALRRVGQVVQVTARERVRAGDDGADHPRRPHRGFSGHRGRGAYEGPGESGRLAEQAGADHHWDGAQRGHPGGEVRGLAGGGLGSTAGLREQAEQGHGAPR